ncbi:uncharacterized protein LOC129801428 [Phlebotomus papatasi]|uniref:uncharacterized protein LOC129801428 n=1 Tax=Phlebotomus papatasi TaxID=29031 RepID=UPI002483F8E3|nr:uncharacterized protein LOC129801428 [Phlebotomus papatasi]
MKYLVIVFVLIALSVADNFEECAKETEISAEEITRFKNDDLTSNDPKAHCFVKCLFRKKEFFDDEGLPQPPKIGRYLAEKNPGKNIKEIMADCLQMISEDGEVACETTYLRYKCAFGKGLLII